MKFKTRSLSITLRRYAEDLVKAGVSNNTELWMLSDRSTMSNGIWNSITWDDAIPVCKGHILIFKTRDLHTTFDDIDDESDA